MGIGLGEPMAAAQLVAALRERLDGVVIIAPCGYHLEATAALAAELVANRRLPPGAEVWAVDADAFFVRPGRQVMDGAELVGQILQPQRRGQPDPSRARRIATG